MPELRKLSVNDGMDVYQMLQDIPLDENGLQNKVNGMTFEEYKDWLIKKQQESEMDGIVDGWKVPSTTYWLYADGGLRHCPAIPRQRLRKRASATAHRRSL